MKIPATYRRLLMVSPAVIGLSACGGGSGESGPMTLDSITVSAPSTSLRFTQQRQLAATGIDNTLPGQADNVQTNSGAAYLFTRNGNAWIQQTYVKAPDTAAFDFFGRPVALSNDGNTVAVGAVGEDSAATGIDDSTIGQGDSSAPSAGAVYLY